MASRATSLLARFRPPAALILAYHSVQEYPEAFRDTIGLSNIHSTHLFAQHLELVARKFNPVALADLLRGLHDHQRVPSRAVAITFDDGYADNYGVAVPLLERFGIPATFYVTAGAIDPNDAALWFIRLRHAFATTQKPEWLDGKRGRAYSLADTEKRHRAFLEACEHCARVVPPAQEDIATSIERELEVEPVPRNDLMMTWDQVRKLHRKGYTVGSHTLSHPNMAHIGEKEARREFEESKRKLEEELGAEVRHFSYPHPVLNPNWTQGTLALCRDAGFKSAVLTANGPVRTGADPYALPRVYTPQNEFDFLWHLERTLLQRQALGTSTSTSARLTDGEEELKGA
ncbi:MAG: polysaccharide deacetylase family protein [Terriglobia bacterium]